MEFVPGTTVRWLNNPACREDTYASIFYLPGLLAGINVGIINISGLKGVDVAVSRYKNPGLLFLLLLLGVAMCSTAWAGRTQDAQGSRDHPLLNRMPGFLINNYTDREFDSYGKFRNAQGKQITVEGKHVEINYFLSKGKKQPSEEQILRNFTSAVKKAGGKLIYRHRSRVYLQMQTADKKVWIYVRAYNRGRSYELHVLEQAAMRKDIVMGASEMAKAVAETGKIALYGIYFDTDRAILKPASNPTLEQIAALLKQKPSLKLFVVGHTDSQGEIGHNLDLSKRRAAVVTKALITRFGINPSRLDPRGVGPLSPASSNETSAGREKNRRTELVKR